MARIASERRAQVRSRSNLRCEYCRKPEVASGFSFQVEHIISLKHHGTSEPTNLAWACVQCNAFKGSDIASYDVETRELTPLFNPRTQIWADHFRMDDEKIVGTTAIGRVTVDVLQMNDSEQLETRRRLLRAGRW